MGVQDNIDEDAIPSLLYVGAIFLATGCSLASGWATAVMNPLVCYNDDKNCPQGGLEFDVSPKAEVEVKQLLTTVLVIGAALGSFMQVIPDRVGYRATLLWVVAPLYAVGTILCAAANSNAIIPMFYAGRFVSGLGCGVGGLVAPVLLAEMAPCEIRGFLTGLHQQFITIGIFLTGLSGFLLVEYVDGGWKYTFVLGMLSPIVLWLTTWAFIPESPRWLLRQRGGRRKVQTLLLNVRPLSYEIADEIQSMQREVDQERRERRMRGTGSAQEEGFFESWTELCDPHHAGVVALGCGLMVVQTLSGINTVIFYSSSILELAGEDHTRGKTTGFFAANVVATVLGLWLLDRVGRRALLIAGYSIMTLSLLGLSATLYTMDNNDQRAAWAAVACVTIYLAGFAVGPGVTTFTLLSEMIPTKIRGKAFGLFMAVNWVCVLLLSQTTLSLIRLLGNVSDQVAPGGTGKPQRTGVASMYLICTFFSLSGLLLVLFFVKETMGTSLEDSARIMEGGEDTASAPVVGTLEDPHAAEALLGAAMDDNFQGTMGGKEGRGLSMPSRGGRGLQGPSQEALLSEASPGVASGRITTMESTGQASMGVLPGSYAPSGGEWGQQRQQQQQQRGDQSKAEAGRAGARGVGSNSGSGGGWSGDTGAQPVAGLGQGGRGEMTAGSSGRSFRPSDGLLSQESSGRSGGALTAVQGEGSRSDSGFHSINDTAPRQG